MKTTETQSRHSVQRLVRWFSVSKPFKSFCMFGVGIGWDYGEHDCCLSFHFGPWMLIIGPHYPPNDRTERQPPTQAVARGKDSQ